MTDPPENNWTPHPIGCNCQWCDDPVTHKELVAESQRVIKVLTEEHAREMDKVRDQLLFLHQPKDELRTVAIMAAILYGKCSEADPQVVAKRLYREVQKTLETDRVITGSIPAA